MILYYVTVLLYNHPWEPGAQFDANELLDAIIDNLHAQDCYEMPSVTELKLQSSGNVSVMCEM